MGVRHFTELRAWQIANRLRIEGCRVVGVPPAVHDRRFCDDIKASAASVCANISEGFGRYAHAEFARFVVIARGSLAETQDHLLDAQDRHSVKPEAFAQMWSLSEDAMRAVSGLLTYLRTHPTPGDRADLRRGSH